MISFVIWELTTEEPIVNLRVFLNRNFAVGCVLIGSVGVVLYGSTELLPLFLQTLLGYPAIESGLAVSPRDVGAIVSMVIVGRMISRLDSRYLIAFGFSVLTVATYMFVGLNLYIAQSNIVYPMLISGFAMGFVFVPLTTMTMATLPQDEIGNATGIYNLMRNTGGSIGISILAFLLARGSQVHQANLTTHTSPYDPAFQQLVEQIKTSMAGAVDTVTATQQAYQIIYGMVVKQAMVLSYLDCFRLLTVMCAISIPAAFLFKRVRHAKAVEGAH
ncbi:MAG: MFS transporter [Acidobacteriota bacterium]